MLTKLYELGYSVIPVNGKRPAAGVTDYRRWATERQPPELIEQYENTPHTGVAIISGPISGITLLDLDTEDKEIHAIFPPSPIVKRGKKGETRVYKYNPLIPNKIMSEVGVDLLNDGAYSVWAGSQHPDGGNYVYLSADTLESIDKKDLPELPVSCLDFLYQKTDASEAIRLDGKFTHSDSSRCPHGSQARLKALAAGLVAGCTPIEKAIKDLLRYDEIHHAPIGYFSDKSRSDFTGDAYSSAAKFYTNILASINRDRARRNEAPQIPAQYEVLEIKEAALEEPKLTNDFPELGGVIGMIQGAIKSISKTDQKDMALGAALAVCGTLSANRFHVGRRPVYTTMYVMNVAGTGAGKGAALDFINELFSIYGIGDNKYFQLQGISNYSSDAAIIDRLSKQRVRLDVVDEFGKIFKGLSSGNDQKTAVGDCLKIMFSAKSVFNGHFTKTDGLVGRCAYPSINILGAIQPETLTTTTSSDLMFDGFMGRFLYFMENVDAPYLGNQLNGGLDRRLLDQVSKVILAAYPANPLLNKDTFGKPLEDDSMCDYTRQEMFESKEFLAYIRDMDMDFNERNRAYRQDGKFMEAILVSRSVEHAEKLAKIICISDCERTVTLKHIETAKKIVDICHLKSHELLLKSGDSKEEQMINKLIGTIARAENKTIKRSAAMKNCHFNSRQMKECVATLIERNMLKEGVASDQKTKILQLV